MSNVLLLIPVDRRAERATAEALAQARALGGRLIVTVVIDPELMDRVSTRLDEVGLMGERVGEGVRSALEREYQTRAAEIIAQVRRAAEPLAVAVDSAVEKGDPTEICTRVARAHQVALALLVAERRSWLTRLLSGGAARVPDLPGCEMRVVEEDE